MCSWTESWTSPCSSASDFTFWKSGKVFGPPGQGHRNMRSLSSVCFGSFHFFCSWATCSLSAGWPCGWSCAEVIRGRGFPRHLFEEEASSQACWFQDCWFQDSCCQFPLHGCCLQEAIREKGRGKTTIRTLKKCISAKKQNKWFSENQRLELRWKKIKWKNYTNDD